MPRILMTYTEIAETFGGDAATARQEAIAMGLRRYKGSDGISYVQLPDMMAQRYLQELASVSIDRQVSALRETASLMRNIETPPARRAA